MRGVSNSERRGTSGARTGGGKDPPFAQGAHTALIPLRPRLHPDVADGELLERTDRKDKDMRQLKSLLSKKIALTFAAVGTVSIVAAGGTYANFTATPVTIGSNAFATGTLEMSRSGSGAIFSASDMAVDEEATGSMTITNTGSLAGDYALSGSASGTLADTLGLVDDDGVVGSKIYDSTLSGFDSVALGTFAGGDAHTFYFHVVLPTTGTDAGDNAFQGQSADATFTWSATQA